MRQGRQGALHELHRRFSRRDPLLLDFVTGSHLRDTGKLMELLNEVGRLLKGYSRAILVSRI